MAGMAGANTSPILSIPVKASLHMKPKEAQSGPCKRLVSCLGCPGTRLGKGNTPNNSQVAQSTYSMRLTLNVGS